MAPEPPSAFLDAIPRIADFAAAADASQYLPLPDGWAMALADVVSSGEAIAAGRYKAVNMGAAAVITAVQNTPGLNGCPFVFGGDGAAVAVPPQGIAAATEALARVARWIDEELGLTMRVALVPLAAIRAAGRDVLVAQFAASPDRSFAMFAGGGAAWAEAEMKAGRFAVAPAPPGARPDLTGLSCRWNPVPARRGLIVSLIVTPGAAGAGPAFGRLVAEIVSLAGGGGGNPLPAEGPVPVLHFGGVEAEARAQAPPGRRGRVRLGIVAAILLTVLCHRTNLTLGGFNARRYGREVAANSDFRKFDDGLKMTVDVDRATRDRIAARLAAAAAEGLCRYGLHAQESALVTCIVPTLAATDHLHFIDGAGGGYALAARALKSGGAA
jgi:hypothetical protein